LARLSGPQKKSFLESQDLFIAGRYADALAELRALLAQLPPNTPAQRATAERAAEAALEAGDQAYAIAVLKPIEEHDRTDCLARMLLARAYAENGQSAERDAEISALTALHKQDPNSPAGKLDMFQLEKKSLKSGGTIGIGYYLRPSGPHNTHLIAQIYNASGKMTLSIELDSDEGDQVEFKRAHPDLAAKGDRRYSLDAYGPDTTVPGGKGQMVHYPVIQFYDGRPAYEVVRQRIFEIAERSGAAQE
jgi:tetratricopeptide (TPR) repeat protein